MGTEFGPELTSRTEKYLRRASVDWHLDETYIRVGGKWRYLWRAVDANGQMIDFRLTARPNARAAKAFLNKAIERVRLHRPVTICTDKAHAYARVIREINQRYDLHFDSIRTIKRGHIHHKQPGVQGEIAFVDSLFATVARLQAVPSTSHVKMPLMQQSRRNRSVAFWRLPKRQ